MARAAANGVRLKVKDEHQSCGAIQTPNSTEYIMGVVHGVHFAQSIYANICVDDIFVFIGSLFLTVGRNDPVEILKNRLGPYGKQNTGEYIGTLALFILWTVYLCKYFC